MHDTASPSSTCHHAVLSSAPAWEAWSGRGRCALYRSGRGHDHVPGGDRPPHEGLTDPAAPGGRQWGRLAVEWGGVCRDEGTGNMQMCMYMFSQLM